MGMDLVRAVRPGPAVRVPDDEAQQAVHALAMLSLALGIGANTAIYSFMDAILLRALPVSDPESLAVLNWHAKPAKWGSFVMHSISGSTYDDPRTGTTAGIFPFPAFELFQKNDAVFQAYSHIILLEI